MNRTPPTDVTRKLRKEVGFACPVPSCTNPYLRWHHFDPPWSKKKHHDPEGMIALCAEHHAKADAGTFTREQLRDLKLRALDKAEPIEGRFDWLRNELVVVAGTNLYLDCEVVLAVHGRSVIWFNRDEDNYLLLNFEFPAPSKEPRVRMCDNFWYVETLPTDLTSPPHGKLLDIRYDNGDHLRVEFLELDFLRDAHKRYPSVPEGNWPNNFPVTAVEVTLEAPEAALAFDSRTTRIGGLQIEQCVFRSVSPAIGL